MRARPRAGALHWSMLLLTALPLSLALLALFIQLRSATQQLELRGRGAEELRVVLAPPSIGCVLAALPTPQPLTACVHTAPANWMRGAAWVSSTPRSGLAWALNFLATSFCGFQARKLVA